MKKYSRYILISLAICIICVSFAARTEAMQPGLGQSNDNSDSTADSLSDEMQMSFAVADSVLPGHVNRHEINIDKSNMVSFTCFGSGNLQLAATDPKGIRTDSATADQNKFNSYLNVPDMNMVYITFGINPPVGKWIVEVSPGKENDKITYYTLTAFFDGSEIKLEVKKDKEYYFRGDTIVVTSILKKGKEPVTGATVEAFIWKVIEAIDTLAMYDDGTHRDSIADDGYYTCTYSKPSLTGSLNISVRAQKGGSEPFTRNGGVGLGIAKSKAKFDGTFSEYTRDTNADNLIDKLYVKVGVKVTDLDKYSIAGELDNSDGKIIASAYLDTFLTSQDSEVLLAFDGNNIYKGRSDGPYHLGHLSLSIMDEEMGYLVDYIENAYVTKKYSVWEFQGGGLEIAGNFADRGIDIDGDGLYDSLVVMLDVDIRESDYYHWQGILFCPGGINNNNIYTFGEGYLEAGKRTITIAFDGDKIGRNGYDGPYEVDAPAMYGQKGTNNLGRHFHTKAYRAAQFEK